MTNEYEQIQFQAMKDSEFSLDDLKFTMRNMYVNGLHKSWRQERGSAMSADVARRDKSGLKCHSRGKTGHFQQGGTTNTKKIANAPNAHKMIKPSRKRTAFQIKWCSFHNTMSWRKQLGNLHKTHQHGKREERVTTLTLHPKKETSEEVTVSKDDLVSLMKRISTSLQEQDSATAPGTGTL